MQHRELLDGAADCVFSTGADGSKQRVEGGDTEEKKSQISADSGLSVTSGSQVGFTSVPHNIDCGVYCKEIHKNVLFLLLILRRRVTPSPWRAQSLLLSLEAPARTPRPAQW